MLPTIEIKGQEISRLIIGGNTISGTSHASREMDIEMEDFFTVAEIKKMLFHCMECGINTMQLRGDKHILRVIREFRQEGGNLKWIAQTAPEFASFEGNVGQMAGYQPALMYHHGVVTDTLYNKGEFDEIKRRLEVIRATGVPAGLCTHMPEVMEYAELHKWDVDFYMCCVYNISTPDKQKKAAEAGNEEPLFVAEDIPVMYEAIRGVEKPCLAFKILGATRRCQTQDSVQEAFSEAFRSIKPTDAVIVGMFPKELDQVYLNSLYTQKAIDQLR